MNQLYGGTATKIHLKFKYQELVKDLITNRRLKLTNEDNIGHFAKIIIAELTLSKHISQDTFCTTKSLTFTKYKNFMMLKYVSISCGNYVMDMYDSDPLFFSAFSMKVAVNRNNRHYQSQCSSHVFENRCKRLCYCTSNGSLDFRI